MPKKFLLLLGLLALSGQASADPLAENLKGLKVTDICPMSGIVYIGDKKDIDLTNLLNETLKQQDSLFGTAFTAHRGLPECSQGAYIIVQTVSLSTGYIYSYDFELFAFEATRDIGFGLSNQTIYNASYYTMGTFGYSPNPESFRKVVIDMGKEFFQNFLLDWRKTH